MTPVRKRRHVSRLQAAYDPRDGNRMVTLRAGSEAALACVSGALGCGVIVSHAQQPDVAVVELDTQTRVRQLCVGAERGDAGGALLWARTEHQLLAVRSGAVVDTGAGGMTWAAALAADSSLSHAAASPLVADEVAFCCVDGSVWVALGASAPRRVGSLGESPPQGSAWLRPDPGRPYRHAFHPGHSAWRACEFAAHPRCLWVANAAGVWSLDMRARGGHTALPCLFARPDPLSALARHPTCVVAAAAIAPAAACAYCARALQAAV